MRLWRAEWQGVGRSLHEGVLQMLNCEWRKKRKEKANSQRSGAVGVVKNKKKSKE